MSEKLNTKGRILLEKGEGVLYSTKISDWERGEKYVVKFRGKFFKLWFDSDGDVVELSEITEKQAKKLVSCKRTAWEEAQKLFGWEDYVRLFRERAYKRLENQFRR